MRATSDPSASRPRTSPLIVRAPLATRQKATAFNQPLSFNTSSVTTMRQMFTVRSARALCPPSLQSGPARCAPPQILLASRPRTSPRIVRPPLLTRQGATAFNQPLSFDTSSVTDMSGMFSVRSARDLAPQPSVRPSPRVHVPLAPRCRPI